MTGKKTVVTREETELPGPDETPKESEFVTLDSEDAFRDLMAGVRDDDDAQAAIYRELGNRKRQFLFRLEGNEQHKLVDVLEELRDNHDGGEFSLEIRRRGQFVSRQVLCVAEPKRTLTGQLVTEDKTHPIAHAQSMDLSPMVEMMERHATQTRDMMTMLITAMKPAERSTDLTEMVTALAAMNKLGNAGGGTDPMEHFLKGLEFGKELTGGGGDTNGFDLMKTALGNLGPVLAGSLPQPMAPGERPAPATQAEASPAPSQPDQMQAALQQLLKAAANDKDPSVYSRVVIDEIGVDMAEQIFIHNLDQFVAQVPAFAPYRTWLDELAVELKTDVEHERVHNQQNGDAGGDQGMVGGAAGGHTGDPSNPQDHGETRQPGKNTNTG